MPDEPKIIVDDDWKKQARAEKAKLAEAEKAAQAKAAAVAARPLATPTTATPASAAGAAARSADPSGAGGPSAPAPAASSGAPAGFAGQQEHPPVDFSEIVRMFGSQALLYMGQIPDPQTGKAIVSLEMAKLHIDMLSVLEEKTRGNLSPDEDTELKGAVGELRMVFVEIARTVAKAMKEGRIGPRGEVRSPAGQAGMMPGEFGPMSGPGFDPGNVGGFPVA